MGQVYKARDSRLDRIVALKVITPLLAGSNDLRQRFEREARTISQFAHPNICTLYDVGEARPEGAPPASEPIRFLVLEYCEGQTLAERILKGPVPIEQAVRIGIDICNALHRAHAAGIVHRDLKPANVMLTAAGAKLLDFGLARPGELVSGAAAVSTIQAPLTEKGTILGTFQYMAPEQIEGEEANARSDIWALGCVLYEMITGHRAFPGKSQTSVIAAILEREPESLLIAQPQAPPILDALIRGCLAKVPADRIQSAHDVGLQLRWIAGATASGSMVSGTLATVAPRRRSRWMPLAIAALAATALTLAFLLLRPAPPPRALVLSIAPPESTFFTPLDGFAVSPDSTAIAFVATGEAGTRTLWVRRFDNVASVPITTVQNPAGPFWSPDGGSIGVFADGFLQVVNLSSGTARPVAPARPSSAAWNEGGQIAFSVEREGLHIVGADGAGRRALTTLDPATNDTMHTRPVFLPGSEFVLFHAERTPTKTDPTVAEIRAVSLATGKMRPLGVAGRVVGFDGGQIVFISPDGALRAQALNPKTLELRGTSRPVRQSDQPARRIDMRYAVSPGGALAYRGGTSQANSRLTWFDRSGKPMGTVGEVDNYSNPALSPDGQRVAVGLRTGQSNPRDLWIFDLVRHTSTRLTHDEGDDFSPAWSPDGTRIAFSSDRAGVRDLYVKPSSGLAQETLLLKSDTPKNVESWSPDGKLLFYGVARGAQSDIDAVRISDGSTSAVLSGPFSESNAAAAPDGTMLAYVSNENGSPEVFVRSFPADDTKYQISTGGGTEPQWRRDQRELFFLAGSTLMAVPIVRGPKGFEPQAPRKLFEQRLSSVLRNRYVVSADGQRFLMNVPATDRTTEPITVILNWRQMPQ
jgi:eukaryotic-like serine/threonine-protein kinase